VLFSDLRGFTSLAEVMAPEALVHILNSYLSVMSNLIMAEQGTLAAAEALAAGAEHFDFLRRAQRYKYRWGRRSASITAAG
jgi:class 3 adenylate cyclase